MLSVLEVAAIAVVIGNVVAAVVYHWLEDSQQAVYRMSWAVLLIITLVYVASMR